jgi:hypothetical protein
MPVKPKQKFNLSILTLNKKPKLSPKVAQTRVQANLKTIKKTIKQLEKVVKPVALLKFQSRLQVLLSQGYHSFQNELKKIKSKKNASLSEKSSLFVRKLTKFKDMLVKRYNRIIEEKKIKAEYKETSIENVKFRRWKPSDLQDFSKFVLANAGTKNALKDLLKKNKYLWNPKGNPKLYMQQQCIETAVLMLIHYCYKKKIDLALPASNGFVAMSQFKTMEKFMKAVYSKLAAVHIYSNRGNLFTEIKKEDIKPGDITSIKRGHGHGYHGLMIVKTDKKGNVGLLSGDQMNKDFMKRPDVRKKVSEIYPLGFIKTMPNATPKEVKKNMHWGGYGIPPAVIFGTNDTRMNEANGDVIKYYRLDPNAMNRVLTRIVGPR